MQMPPDANITQRAIQLALAILGVLMLAGAFVWMVLKPEHSLWGLFYLNFAVVDFYLAWKLVRH